MNNEQLRARILDNLEVVLRKREGDLARSLQSLDSLRQDATGHLGHYLANRSYEKAWILLHGENPEKGVCG